MADNTQLPATGTGTADIIVATDKIGGVDYQRIKLSVGDDGSAADVKSGGGTEAGSLRVTVASDSTGVLSVDDNGSTLSVDDGAGSLTVDGSVTANAGTNLNTSALALETGGNLAGAATSLAVIDDWDESDRAKVNPIAGQAGVQGGSGTVTALTQRVVLATDVALPAGTNAIGKLAANSGVDIGDVDVTSVSGTVTVAGTVQPGNTQNTTPWLVGPLQAMVTQTPTVSTSPAYVAGDALGGKLTFTDAARASGGSGSVVKVVIICKKEGLRPTIDLFLFNQDFTAMSDNATWAPSDGDMANSEGKITISDWASEDGSPINSVATRTCYLPFALSGTANLYGQMVTRTGFTANSTSDFIVNVTVQKN